VFGVKIGVDGGGSNAGPGGVVSPSAAVIFLCTVKTASSNGGS